MHQTPWQCPNCDEQVDGTLETCWQCGCSQNGDVDPDFVPKVYSKLVTNQDQAVCDQCGYMLRGLTEHRCPECGEEFDLVKGDTIPPPKLPDDHPIAKRRRKWLLVWVLSWLFASPLMSLMTILMWEYQFNETVCSLIIILCVFAIVVTPILFGLSLLPEHKDKRTISNANPQPSSDD